MANEHIAGTGAAGSAAIADTTAIRVKPEVDDAIAMVEPAEAPLDTLLRLVASRKSVENPVFNVQEEHPLKNITTVSAAEAATDTVIGFDDASFLVPTHLGLNVRTGEQIRINTDATLDRGTGVVTGITRSFGSNAAAAMVAGDTIVWMSTALEEGQDKIQARMRATGSHRNRCQMIEHGISITEQNALLGVFGVNERSRLDAQGILEFRKMRNRAFLLGQQNGATDVDQIVHSTDGLRQIATQFNNANIGPGVTYSAIALALSQVIRHGGGVSGRRLWGLTDQATWNLISGLPEITALARTTPDDDTIGFEITKITFPGGMLNLTIDHNLESFGGEIIVFDLNFLEVKQLIPTTVRIGVQTPGAHRHESQIFSQEGLAVKLPLSTARLYNLKYVA